jgi:glycosyltransferase involved in cell wall biosynthesis
MNVHTLKQSLSTDIRPNSPSVAVIVPCFNEAVAIGKVVTDFRSALPDARVYVYDNNSTDGTADLARAAGATVRAEPLQGKGNVVRRMFRDIDADVYVMVDGDDTYAAADAPRMVELLLLEQLDCVNGVRRSDEQEAYRFGHRIGNRVLTALVTRLFGRVTEDMLTGYRVFSRRFVKSFPALSSGFEIETEITVHALQMRMRVADVETRYRGRPAGSASKLRTYTDGLNILGTIIELVKQERPLLFFNSLGAACIIIALALFAPVLIEYLQTGLVRRMPTAILSSSLVMLAFVLSGCGLILDTVTRGRKEIKLLAYLAIRNRL